MLNKAEVVMGQDNIRALKATLSGCYKKRNATKIMHRQLMSDMHVSTYSRHFYIFLMLSL